MKNQLSSRATDMSTAARMGPLEENVQLSGSRPLHDRAVAAIRSHIAAEHDATVFLAYADSAKASSMPGSRQPRRPARRRASGVAGPVDRAPRAVSLERRSPRLCARRNRGETRCEARGLRREHVVPRRKPGAAPLSAAVPISGLGRVRAHQRRPGFPVLRLAVLHRRSEEGCHNVDFFPIVLLIVTPPAAFLPSSAGRS